MVQKKFDLDDDVTTPPLFKGYIQGFYDIETTNFLSQHTYNVG